MKKLVTFTLCLVLICCLFTGCAGSIGNSSSKINIVCTIYPQYDWVMNLLGNNADDYNVTLLVSNGTDLHSYQPSAKDIVTIKSCDLLIYVGGTSDIWIQELLDDSANENMITINMMEALGDMAKTEEIVEGMEIDHEHEDEDSHTEQVHPDEHNNDVAEYDEHIWLSLRNGKSICEEITSALCKLDSENTEHYNSALHSYSESLQNLDKQYADMVSTATRTTLLFGDRFPFRYMTDDYNIDYYAAFAGCSADTEASFQTIVFLADKMDSLAIPGVCVTESTDRSLAKTIIENTATQNHEIYVFDSMQSVTSKDIENGVTYLSIMEDNLEVLKSALN